MNTILSNFHDWAYEELHHRDLAVELLKNSMLDDLKHYAKLPRGNAIGDRVISDTVEDCMESILSDEDKLNRLHRALIRVWASDDTRELKSLMNSEINRYVTQQSIEQMK